MSELIFPLLGPAFVLLVCLPACSLVARWVLRALDMVEAWGSVEGLRRRYVILTGSTLLPLCWLFSAALHQAESGRSVVACLFEHDETLCFEPGLFVAVLALACGAAWLRVVRSTPAPRLVSSARTVALQARLDALVASRPELAILAGRVNVTEDAEVALYSWGFWRSRVLVDAAYAAASTDEELTGALTHEAEHVRSRDPLRYFVLAFAMAVNPVGRRLIERDVMHWLAGREAHCDREAVIRGAEPLALAQALLRAARPSGGALAALGAGDAAVLRLRVQMLLAFEERMPTACCARKWSLPTAEAILVLLVALLPHHAGTAALDFVHVAAEHAIHGVWY